MKHSGKATQRLKTWLATLQKEDRWCVLITADPDALASAMAFKRILAHRAQDVVIASTNEVTRPDNLAMLRYLRIPLIPWKPEMIEDFDKFAIVDSQPNHHPLFAPIRFSVIIDHHPLPTNLCHLADFTDIRPGIGATCTIFTRYLQSLAIKPSKLLATALLYGIRTDTAAFERGGDEIDLRAYQWLSKHANTTLLRRILRSEYLMDWLPLFSHAFRSLRTCTTGAHAHVGRVSSPDLLVAIADFFTRVHGLRWVAVSGVYANLAVVIFRGDGSRNLGNFAAQRFGKDGSAGGHKNMARAEIPLEAIIDQGPQEYIYAKLVQKKHSRGNAD